MSTSPSEQPESESNATNWQPGMPLEFSDEEWLDQINLMARVRKLSESGSYENAIGAFRELETRFCPPAPRSDSVGRLLFRFQYDAKCPGSNRESPLRFWLALAVAAFETNRHELAMRVGFQVSDVILASLKNSDDIEPSLVTFIPNADETGCLVELLIVAARASIAMLGVAESSKLASDYILALREIGFRREAASLNARLKQIKQGSRREKKITVDAIDLLRRVQRTPSELDEGRPYLLESFDDPKRKDGYLLHRTGDRVLVRPLEPIPFALARECASSTAGPGVELTFAREVLVRAVVVWRGKLPRRQFKSTDKVAVAFRELKRALQELELNDFEFTLLPREGWHTKMGAKGLTWLKPPSSTRANIVTSLREILDPPKLPNLSI